MSVSAIIVTRGDVDLDPVLESLPDEWEKIEWNNGEQAVYAHPEPNWYRNASDLAVYGRYAAIEHASNDLIYVQDDDVLHTTENIREMVKEWGVAWRKGIQGKSGTLNFHVPADGHVVCNMPAAFRARHFYDEHSLVGFGGVFHRDAPARAFERYLERWPLLQQWERDHFHRTCDIVFTALTPRILVDIDYQDMPWASAPNRMWKQPTHQEERSRMLELVLQVRDAG